MSTIGDAEREMFGDPGDPLDYCERCRGYRVPGHQCDNARRDRCTGKSLGDGVPARCGSPDPHTMH